MTASRSHTNWGITSCTISNLAIPNHYRLVVGNETQRQSAHGRGAILFTLWKAIGDELIFAVTKGRL